MLSKPSLFLRPIILLVCLLLVPLGANSETTDEKIDRLERLIQRQQQQLERQAEQIETLQRLVGAPPPAAPPAAAEPVATVPDRKLIVNSTDKVKLELYGQLNRGLLYVDDGDVGKLYNVDNDNSSTRIGLRGSVETWNGWTVGTLLEVEYQSNASNLVSREKPNTTGDKLDDRHIDLYVQSERYGKLSIGQGDTASNDTSEVDYSGTTVASYSDVTTVAGGQLFFDKSSRTLSGVKISDVFSNFDGLSRKDRLRYDTPVWLGWQGATSVVSGSGADLAVRYNSTLEGYKIGAAVAYSDPGSASSNIDSSLNGSASILHPSGWNLTLAAGEQDQKVSGRNKPTFLYAKAGYIASLTEIGKTAFSIDYAYNEDVARDGDKAKAAGFQCVHNIDRWATEIYLSYRYHDLERSGTDFDAIMALLTGLRVKF